MGQARQRAGVVRRWLRPLVAAVAVVSGLTASGVAHAETVTRTVFTDGFTGDRGTGADAAKWSGGSQGAWLDGDGNLVLNSWLSSVPTFNQATGHVSARIRAGRSSGAWRSLGVLNEAGGMLSGRVETLGRDEVDDYDFHTFAIDWTRTAFVWSVDGEQVLRLTPDTAAQPFRLALNMGGGDRYSSGILVDSVTVTVRVTVVKPAKAWKTFTTYQVGDRVTYRGATYRVLARHTALPDWEPGLVPELFQKV